MSVLIPTYNAARFIRPLLAKLYSQRLGGRRLEIRVCDSSSTDGTVDIIHEYFPEVLVESIPNEWFDHGGTRNKLAAQATGGFLLFMTQDAIPCNDDVLLHLLNAFDNPDVSVSFARQIPKDDAGILEAFARSYNYPELSESKHKGRLEELGIKTFFNSNVCSMYRREHFMAYGGFPEQIILNEDMILASRAIYSGRHVYYCAEAQVYHSHNYNLKQQFKRYFDIGMAFQSTAELFRTVSNEREGMKMIRRQARYLLERKRPDLIVYALFENVCKLVGYQLGKRSQRLPRSLKKQLSAYMK